MKYSIHAFILCIFLTISLPYAYGKRCWSVLDEQGNPVARASIAATDTLTEEIIEVTLTDHNGYGCLTKQFMPGTGLIVTANGFLPYRTLLNQTESTIILEHAATDLEELTVSATKDHLTQKDGAFVFTPGSLKTEVANIYDLIKYTPLVNYEDGLFKILGRMDPAKIKINGEDPRAWGTNVRELLQSLPATRVKRVEVIPNDGIADTAGLGGGAINIVITLRDEGELSRANASLGYRHGFSTDDSYWLGWKRGKTKGSVTLSFSEISENTSHETRSGFLDIDKYVDQVSEDKSERQNLSGGASLSYNLTSTGTLGCTVTMASGHKWSSGDTNGSIIQNGVTNDTRFQRLEMQPWYTPEFGVGIWYTDHPNPHKNTLDIYTGYGHKAVGSYNIYNDLTYTANDNQTRQNLNNNAHAYYVQAQFIQVLNQNHYLSSAYQLNGVRSQQKQEYIGNPIDDFRCNQVTNTLFAQWNANWNDRLSTQISLRGEHLLMSGVQAWTGERFSKHYTQVFPSATMSLNIPKGEQGISFSLSRTEEIPLYYLLNPYIRWVSETSYFTGNPNLEPSYGWNTELIYTFLGHWTAGLNWTHHPKSRVNYTYYKDGFTVSSYANIEKEDWLNIYAQFYRSFWQRLRINVTGKLSYTAQSGVIEENYLNSKTLYATIDLKLNYLISRPFQWRANIDFLYHSPDKGLTNNGTNSFRITANLSKDWKCGLNLNLGIKYSPINQPLEYYSDKYTNYSKISNRPQFSLGIAYSFGNMRVTGAEERQMEIK